MVFHELKEQKILEGVKQAYIIITHMHPDDVGSLSDEIFYFYYLLNHKVILIYPNAHHLENFLKIIGVRDVYLIRRFRK